MMFISNDKQTACNDPVSAYDSDILLVSGSVPLIIRNGGCMQQNEQNRYPVTACSVLHSPDCCAHLQGETSRQDRTISVIWYGICPYQRRMRSCSIKMCNEVFFFVVCSNVGILTLRPLQLQYSVFTFSH